MKINKSLNYILPLVYYALEEELSLPTDYFGKEVMPHLKNSYIRYEDLDCFALLLSNKCDKFLENCNKSNIFVKSIDDEEVVLVVFEIPKAHISAFNHFVNGRYSFISEDEKALILAFAIDNAKGLYDHIANVLYRKKELRESIEKDLNVKLSSRQELSSKIVENAESYRAKEKIN